MAIEDQHRKTVNQRPCPEHGDELFAFRSARAEQRGNAGWRLHDLRWDDLGVADRLGSLALNLRSWLVTAALFSLLTGLGLSERFFLEMCKAGVLVNLVMWAFNLFPLPPLDGGRILVGLQVPKAEHKAFQSFLEELAYPYVDETDNPVYRLFLRT